MSAQQTIPTGRIRSGASRANRFMERVAPEPNSGCWLWLGEMSAQGYGVCWTFGRRETAHQAAYREFVCEASPGQIIRHCCDTPLCCNPDHLVAGTHADNVADKVARNRQARGLRHGSVKLTEDQVREIRASSLSQRVAAKRFGVTQPLIGAIRRRKIWRHI